MANKYDTMVSSIVDLVGGKENIRSFAHCVTRLRFNVKDKGLVDEAKIRELPGAVGTQWSGNQLQVIIGNDVENVYKQIAKANNLAVEPEVSAESADEKKKNIVVKLIEMLSGCVIPLVPILMGAGMIKVFYLLAVRLGILSTESSTYIVLDFVNNAAFYFLPVFAGATAAKKFGGSMSIGMLVGAMLIHPTFISAVSGGTALTIFGLPIYATSYTNSIFPVILSVWVMSKIENFLKKHVPEWLRAIAVPTLTLHDPGGVLRGRPHRCIHGYLSCQGNHVLVQHSRLPCLWHFWRVVPHHGHVWHAHGTYTVQRSADVYGRL